MVEFSHKIVKGDNLSNIAKTHGTNINEILKDNPQFRSNPNLIFEGQEVKMDSEKLLEEGFTCPGCHLEHAEEPCPEGASGDEGAPAATTTAAPEEAGGIGPGTVVAGMTATALGGVVIGAGYKDEFKAFKQGAIDKTKKGINAATDRAKSLNNRVNAWSQQQIDEFNKNRQVGQDLSKRAETYAPKKTQIDPATGKKVKGTPTGMDMNKKMSRGVGYNGNRIAGAPVLDAEKRLARQQRLRSLKNMQRVRTFKSGVKAGAARVLKSPKGRIGAALVVGTLIYSAIKD